jgi:uncharacterized protein YndB with AHSA1/START domain
MALIRVTEFIDIEAPQAEVFELLLNVERRMQLSPLWGMVKIVQQCGDFPAVGSGYLARLVEGDHPEYETVITEYEPPRRLAYCLDIDLQTTVAWTVQATPRGARLTYEESFQAPIVHKAEADPAQADPAQADPAQTEPASDEAVEETPTQEEFTQSVRKVIHEWLANIKRYAELRQTRTRRLIKWALDRYYLHLRPDQRQVIAIVLFMQITGMIAFTMAAIGLGLASLLF